MTYVVRTSYSGHITLVGYSVYNNGFAYNSGWGGLQGYVRPQFSLDSEPPQLVIKDGRHPVRYNEHHL